MSDQKHRPQNRHEFESTLVAKAQQNEAFKQELISNPKAVYTREFGQQIPDSLAIQVLEETPGTVYLVIPRNSATAQVTEELSEQALEAVAGKEAQPSGLISGVLLVGLIGT